MPLLKAQVDGNGLSNYIERSAKSNGGNQQKQHWPPPSQGQGSNESDDLGNGHYGKP
jgi:hypothetical protein